MSPIWLIIVVTIACSVLGDSSVTAMKVQQKLTLYSDKKCTGKSLVINETSPNLLKHKFTTTKSVHSTGIWIFYSDVEHNAKNSASASYDLVITKDRNCNSLKAIKGNVLSVRVAGVYGNLNAASISLFQFNKYYGKSIVTQKDVPILSSMKEATSLIITGSESWTVYSLPEFKGERTCVSTSLNYPDSPVFEQKTKFQVQSVTKGCN